MEASRFLKQTANRITQFSHRRQHFFLFFCFFLSVYLCVFLFVTDCLQSNLSAFCFLFIFSEVSANLDLLQSVRSQVRTTLSRPDINPIILQQSTAVLDREICELHAALIKTQHSLQNISNKQGYSISFHCVSHFLIISFNF